MVAVDNRERIADALSALIEGLAPVVADTLSAAAPELTDWTELLAHKDRAQGRHGLRYSQRDVSLMLRALTERLGTLGYPFERVLGRRGSNYASELREVRNRWAHHDEFSAAETYRALDSAELLLQLVGAGEQAARVAELKVGLLPAAPTLSRVLEPRGVVTPATEASDDGRQENISDALHDHELPDQPLDSVGAGDDDIVVHITHTSLLSYAMAHNQLQVVGEIRIENDGVEQRGASVEISVITAHGELGDPKILLVDLSAGATTVLRDVDLLLDPARMLAVDEQTPGIVRVTVRRTDGTPLIQTAQPVSVLPANHWRSGDGDLSYELLPAFVQPNALVIASLLTEASTRLEAATGSSALDGYQTESAERVDAIVRAVCEAMIARDIRYAEPPAGWQRGQKVRTPAEVLEGRLGTCLDTTVTLAAALEQAGIHTTLWLVPGHIFLGYWRGERLSLDVPVETSPEFAINAVDLGLIKLVEAVKLTGGDSASDYESVLDAPRIWLTDQDNIEAVVDVAVARQRVLPLPSRSIAPDGTVTVTIYQPAEQDTATYVSTGGGRHRDLEVVPPRVSQWKNALLDLSLRNRLINYTATAGYSLAVPGRSIARLEDMVNNGTAISLLPSDQISAVEAARGVRYARDLGEQARDALLAEKKAVHIDVTGAAYTGKLRYLANKAKTVVEETGANNLYLAFGMLRWRAGDRDLRSPLILVPVTLETHSRGNAFRLKLDEAGSSTPNYCLLEKLRLQFGITIPGLANPAEDDAGIDLAAAFEATRLAILQAGLPFLVEESVDLAILQFSKFRLWKDLDENWEAFAGNPLVRHLIETPLEPFIDPVAARAEVDLDQLGALSPVPADSSQLDAVAEAVNDRTFVLEGPPGTGKSQTITNLLARALAEGKRVLFVAEKRAALEVVKKRLEAVGLGRLSLDLHDKGARPTAVRQQIKQALELRVASDSAGFAAAVKTSATARGALDRYARRLHDENAAGFSLYSARGEELAGDQAITPLPIPETFVANTDFEQIDALRDVLAALPETADLARPRPDHPWGFLDNPDGQTLGAEAVYDAALAYDSALDAVLRTGMRADTIERAGVGGMRRFAQVAGAPRHPLAAVDALGGADWRSFLTTLKERLKAAQTNLPTVLQEVRPEALHLDVQSLHAQAQAADQSSFFGRKKRRRAVSAQFAHTLVGGPDSLQPKRVSEVTAGLVAAEAASAELKAAVESVPVPIIDTGWHAWDPGAIDAVLAKLQWIDWLTAALRVDAADTINEELRSVYAETLMGAASVEYERLAEATAAFRSAARLDGCALLLTWAQDGFTARWIATAPARQLASGRAGLDRWLDYVRATAPIRTAGLDAARVGLLNGTTAADTAVLAFDRGLAVASIAERRDAAALADFDVESHNRTIERFTATASTLRSALPAVIPAGVLENRSFDAMSSGGQIGGLRRQLDRQRNGMSVRALMENYGDVITRIAPCTLISPESVARFFPARAGLFDIVVFDEASQIRVADAVGAMGRGRSVVVVGDSKQMPPTSFAEASIGGEEDASETVGTVQDEESILTECVQAQVPSKWLSWHYRSQDESLISFSNHHYYDDRLSSFPAPLAGAADDTAHGHGISLIRVDGHFERSGKGKTLRTNRVEADAIVADILRRFAESPDESPSVGVVTFNSQQRDLIENLLRDSEEPRAAIALDEPDGLFVKNLENVQGDERDAILFSIAFSANERGVVPLNFGPLTRAGGERRLNVAITRARRQVVLYSSFDPSELRTHETASIGLKHLRAYLELAQRGVEAEAAGLARQAYMDRHREQIADELRMRGFAVSTDIGLSDFRVDISVAKPEDPTKPLVAILLDGSQWRSRRTVADRDGLPVEVLGNLMRWPAVERIWLPEWLRDREGVLARVSVTVDEAARPVSKSPPPSSSIEGGPASDADLGAGTGTALTSASDFEVDRPASGRDTSVDQLSPGALRLAPPATPRRHPAIEDFTPWKPTSHGTIAVLDDLPRSTAQRRVQAVVTDVIRAEAPISRARLAKLVAGAFGLERVAQARVSAILRCVPQQHVAAGDTEFFWPEGATPDTWMTVRSSPDNPARPVEAIPLEELANALRVAADQLAGGSESELKRAALALFGIKRLTAQVDDRMSAALGLAIESGRLGRGSGGLLISGHPSDPPPLPSGGVASVVDSSRVAAHSADAARALDVTQAAGPIERPDSNRPTSGSGFAVIDFETTGLFSNGHDRIVEVAVVHVDRFGNVTGAWDTLVNPGRDIGATRIHGIIAAAVVSAPTFAQIAPRLVELLSGRVIVAHNAKFDTGFLLAELNRLQYAPELQLSGLCTMQLAREFLPGSRRRLSDCCAAFDIELEGAHRASVDALATAKLLSAYMGLSDDLTYWHRLIDAAAEVGWPPMAVVEAEWVAREVAEAEPPTFLERIGLRMPDHSGPDEHQEYLALLDRALLDRRLSAHERDGLVSLATDLGIGRDKALELHQVYFDDIVGIAWDDGVLTQAELADIVLVGGLLGIDAERVTAATAIDKASRTAGAPTRAATLPDALRLSPGDLIVLTGEMSRPREEWIAELTSRGLVVWPGVTKKVRLVVAADPDSMSGKARKARDYGITIVDEAGLVALLAR